MRTKIMRISSLSMLAIFALLVTLWACTSEKDRFADYKNLPTRYLFLLFPKVLCSSAATGFCVDRVILVEKSELDSGIITFSDSNGVDRTVALDSLSLLPTEETKTLLHNWEKAFKTAGYSNGTWEFVDTGSGVANVKLTLTDSKHLRRELYQYSIKNDRVIGGSEVTISPWEF